MTFWLLWDRASAQPLLRKWQWEFCLAGANEKKRWRTREKSRVHSGRMSARPQRLFAFCARHSIRDRPPLFLCRHAEARQKSTASSAVRLLLTYYCEFLCSASLKILHFPPPPLIDTYRTRGDFSLSARG